MWMGFNYFKTTEPLRGDNLFLPTDFPRVSGIAKTGQTDYRYLLR